MSDEKLARLDRRWRDKRNWKFFYAVYYCKDDPRIIVPKINRSGRPIKWLGTTWNFAHLGAYPTIVLFAALAIGPTAYMVYSGFGGWLPWCTTPIEADSSLGPDSHHPIISLSGIPSAVMVFRILHPILASTLCAANPLARIAEPTIAL